MFAAFDVTKHLISMHARSPSFQIRRETLTAAAARGFFPQIRGNEEIAVAFRPDFFATYADQMESLHQTAKHAADVKNLETIAASEKKVQIKDVPAGPRKTVLEQIQRKVRDARFRGNVLAAYENRCAISGMQLDLLDAAHIIPVEHKRGTDEVRNGLSVTVLHHRAFDHGLIGIKSDYSIIVNDREMDRLRRIGWDGGEKAFRATLRDQILLPARREYYPEPDYLTFGQSLRGWNERALR
jgi:putative restriction endonuclease